MKAWQEVNRTNQSKNRGKKETENSVTVALMTGHEGSTALCGFAFFFCFFITLLQLPVTCSRSPSPLGNRVDVKESEVERVSVWSNRRSSWSQLFGPWTVNSVVTTRTFYNHYSSPPHMCTQHLRKWVVSLCTRSVVLMFHAWGSTALHTLVFSP